MLEQLRTNLQHRKFSILLLSLLSMVVVPALRGRDDDMLSGLLVGIVLVAAVHAVSERPRVTVIFTAVAIVVFSGRLASLFGDRLRYQDTISAGSFAVGALFLAMTLVMVFRAVLRAPHVTGDSVMGAVAVYLLIGFMWANLYAFVEFSEPGSFNFPAYARADNRPLIPEHTFGYYSFVTLTTLGFGDVTPITLRARTLSWLEAVVGVSYMATVIAFLVSQVVADQREGRSL